MELVYANFQAVNTMRRTSLQQSVTKEIQELKQKLTSEAEPNAF